MGNKFKLSDMIPNAWFYKLRDMSKTRKKNKNPKNIKKNPTLVSPITTTKTTIINTPAKPRQVSDHQPPHEPPRKSSKRRSTSSSSSRRRKPVVFKPHSRFVSSSSASSSSESEALSLFPSENDDAFLRLSSSTADIIIDLETYEVKRAENNNNKNVGHRNPFDGVDLPPILTKPINFDDTIFEAAKNYRSRTKTTAKNSSSSSSSTQSLSVKIVKEEKTVHRQKITSHNQKCSSSSSSVTTGIRLRPNSPRLASKKVQACARKSLSYSRNKQYLSESLAVVKSSVDPQRDFRDSMVEMIVENNIRASKDLEELLACYLTLNSKEYHDVIVKAFEQIWFDMAGIRT